MRQRLKDLNWYQKGILLLLLALMAVFAVIYHASVSRVGVLYQDEIFVPAEENGVIVYTGTLDAKPAAFTVSSDKTAVTFRCGDTVYGPYTIKADPSALADITFCPSDMIGVELYDGETLLFRGGFWPSGDVTQLFPAEGSPDDNAGIYFTENGVWKDADGNAWFGAVVVSIVTAFSILYADELFRWNLSFQIRDVENAEPSEWEMLSRYLSWTALTIMAVVVYIMGLK